jgi:alkanesulfonate monooxygenase SsuD/methylene tetrahydromethanopterin reductase-like flavin-dependent oxidoreductase (luciferase family)
MALIVRDAVDPRRAYGQHGRRIGGEKSAVGMLTDGRGKRLENQLRRLRELWSGDWIGPSPTRPGGPPLLLAGYVPRAIERTARLADGWTIGVGTIEQFRAGLAILREAWVGHRRSGQPRALAMAYFALGRRGRAAAEHDLHHYYGWLGPDIAADIAAGALTDPGAIIHWLNAYAEAGAGAGGRQSQVIWSSWRGRRVLRL